jgi:hypothetical protein
MPTIDLPSGIIHYRAAGPEQSTRTPVVFVHAFLMNGAVWSRVAGLLAERGIRSYAPDWPLGALVQFVLDTDPRRVGRVVLTNCDAFDTFPPFPFNVIFGLLKGPRRMKINLLPMRSRAFRHSPLGFGLLANELEADLTRSWIEPALTQPGIRDDAVRLLRALDPRELLDVSTRLKDYLGRRRSCVHPWPRPAAAAGLPERRARRSAWRPDTRPARRTGPAGRADR